MTKSEIHDNLVLEVRDCHCLLYVKNTEPKNVLAVGSEKHVRTKLKEFKMRNQYTRPPVKTAIGTPDEDDDKKNV